MVCLVPNAISGSRLTQVATYGGPGGEMAVRAKAAQARTAACHDRSKRRFGRYPIYLGHVLEAPVVPAAMG